MTNGVMKKVLQEGGSFQGPRVGSCLTPGNELWEGTQELTEVEVLLRKGALGREQQGEGTQDCSASWLSLQLHGDGIRFQVVSGQSL